MNKILLSLGTIALVATVGIGGTVAYFSDVETSSQNTFAAGTLDLGLDNASNLSSVGSITQTWSTTNWAPGETQSGTLYVHNAGSVAAAHAKVAFNYGDVTGAGPASTVHNPGSSNLGAMIQASTVTWGTGADLVHVADIEGQYLSNIKAHGAYTLPSGVNPTAEKPLNIVWTFDTSADNNCQNRTVDVTATVTLTQD
jgi:predicted ribosomally synthesized peptide with SipW-like signal peptide